MLSREASEVSLSLDADIDTLWAKIDAGATRAITQFFFDNEVFFRFLDRARARGITIPIVPGLIPIHNFQQVSGFAHKLGTSMPDGLGYRFDGLEQDQDTRHLVAAAGGGQQVLGLVDRGITEFHFYTLNCAEFVYAICHLLGLRPVAAENEARRGRAMTRAERIEALKREAAKRIMILDGAMGTMIQRYGWTRRDFRGTRFPRIPRPQGQQRPARAHPTRGSSRGSTTPYLEAGADIIETNTFNTQAISQADYGLEDIAYELNVAAAKLARDAADAWTAKTPDKPRFVAGAIGPTNRTASLSPDVNNPGFRNVQLRCRWSRPMPCKSAG